MKRGGMVLTRLVLLALALLTVLAAPAGSKAKSPAYNTIRLPGDARMHPEAQTEWWYYTGHLQDTSGHRFGFEMVTFKLQGLKKADPRSPLDTGYRIDVAITDETAGTFQSIVNYVLPAAGKTVMSSTNLTILAPGGSGSMAVDTLPGPGLRYRLRGSMAAAAIDVTVDTTRKPLLEGGNGVVSMGTGGFSYYYSLTNMQTAGTLTLNGHAYTVHGTTWMDHQWGSWKWDKIRGWDWMGVQLANGTSIVLTNFDGSRLVAKSAGVSFPDGSQLFTPDSAMTPGTGAWTSPVTAARYPQGWHIKVPAIGLDAQVTPTLANQEVVDPLSLGPTYWEGSCRVSGTLRGKPITGQAYTELVGYAKRSAGMF